MAKYKAPRGTKDVLPDEIPEWRFVEETFRHVCSLYGYREIRTPAFEETELFVRTAGESSDIVTKQMYTFSDPGGESYTLRPEGTAPTVRAYIQHNLGYGMPLVKLFYIAPIFRYERPQAGRLRQHHQVGIEVLGSSDPAVDAEVVALGVDFLSSVGVSGYEIHINSVGCQNCRPAYRQALIGFLEPLKDGLCEDCKRRLKVNPLRILDCKEEICKALTASAPRILAYLCDECRVHFESVLSYLKTIGVELVVDSRLVRGLDYYTKTTFEFLHPSLGAQSAVLAGGRYDGLVEECGGKRTPGIGFGCGIERVLILRQHYNLRTDEGNIVDVFVCAVGESVRQHAFKLLKELRCAGVRADMDYLGRSLKAQMRFADRLGATYVVIIGDEELSNGVATLRAMRESKQQQVPLDKLVDYLRSLEERGS
ncbi:MAG: histidine--tRNA ligase [Armatimonadota bacterium]|nr:histidine--tRNA ligase [Armatimonadota bacterium]MCX7777906.1 histidine--tRNA ligase [Armatimonadota bacterium]MDW8026124.1 histidine--tRNA ligase [Armatimonadota bacterium]